ncbi:MAG: hypothetical protein JWP94_1779 [Mucilaginibacter sp.]|nr:hypothetical protein [Mucilaginibacter sp.]
MKVTDNGVKMQDAKSQEARAKILELRSKMSRSKTVETR